jgi:glycosyltransferase involved in cell wall biosynthesis
VKVAILNWKDPWHPKAGGAESYVWEVAKELIHSGHTVTLYTAKYPGASDIDYIDGVKIERLGNRVSVYWRIPRRVRSTHPGMVIDVVNTRPFMTPLWHKKMKSDVDCYALIFQTAEEVWYEETPNLLAFFGKHLLEPWWLSAYANFPTWTISDSSITSLNSFGLKKVKNLGIGIPNKTSLANDDSEVIEFEGRRSVCFCSRLVSMKRPFDAIRAFEIFHETIGKEVRYSLEVIGSGDLYEEIKIAAINSEFDIIIHGRVSESEKQEIYRRSFAILGTSVREGWGLTMSEGAQQGALPVAYGVPGLTDSVRAAGGLLSAENPDSLAEALVIAVTNEISVDHSSKLGLSSWKEIASRALCSKSEFQEFSSNKISTNFLERLMIFVSNSRLRRQ